MTIDEAIRKLYNQVASPRVGMHASTKEAIKLGIEALKYVKSQYDPDHQFMRRPLPGETFE